MPVDTIKRNKRQYEWMKEKAERINLLLEKGTKQRIESAKDPDVSISEFVRDAINEKIDRMQAQ